MRRQLAAIGVALAFGVAAATAQAAPALVNVRIEGNGHTVFDHAIQTDGHDVRAASDTRARPCDGTNNGANRSPGPTATAAAVDAVTLLGQGWDGTWNESFEDYFVTRWGDDPSDAEPPDLSADWGLLVDRAFSPTGGCQARVGAGDEVLWAFDALSGKQLLSLSGPRDATVGEPIQVEVDGTGTGGASDGAPSQPFAGATVAAVDELGRPAAGVAGAAASGADGSAAVTFARPGWQRLKARDDGAAIASNSIDVCVHTIAGAGCTGQPLSSRALGEAPPGGGGGGGTGGGGTGGGGTGGGGTGGGGTGGGGTGGGDTGGGSGGTGGGGGRGDGGGGGTGGGGHGGGKRPVVRITGDRVPAGRPRGRRVRVAWTVAGARGGSVRFTLKAREHGRAHARFKVRARGSRPASRRTATTRVRLRAGRRYDLRLTVFDGLGRASRPAKRTVIVPWDDRSSRLRYHRRWRRLKRRSAWRATLRRGRRGGRAVARLPAGRPAFVLRGASRRARVRIESRGRRRTIRVRRLAAGRARVLRGPRRRHGGHVTLRVIRGTVKLDGVAVLR